MRMNNIFQWLNWVVDLRQEHKIKHLMKDVIMIVFFAKIANADEWTQIHYFAVEKEEFLRKYLELPNGKQIMFLPSKQTTGFFMQTQNSILMTPSCLKPVLIQRL